MEVVIYFLCIYSPENWDSIVPVEFKIFVGMKGLKFDQNSVLGL